MAHHCGKCLRKAHQKIRTGWLCDRHYREAKNKMLVEKRKLRMLAIVKPDSQSTIRVLCPRMPWAV